MYVSQKSISIYWHRSSQTSSHSLEESRAVFVEIGMPHMGRIFITGVLTTLTGIVVNA